MKRIKTNKKHSTNSEVQRIKKDIRSLRDIGKSDIEIRETLGLELRNYQKYTKMLHLEDQQVWLSITQEQLGSELLRLKQSLEHTYNTALAMAQDPEYEDRLSALQAKDDARLNVIKLLSEYKEFKRQTQIQTEEEEQVQPQGTLPRIH
jgi:hypothetical protein